MIQDEDVALYIRYLIENDQIKLNELIRYIRRMIIQNEEHKVYVNLMKRLRYGQTRSAERMDKRNDTDV
jgi:hypothetical protein